MVAIKTLCCNRAYIRRWYGEMLWCRAMSCCSIK